MAFDRDRGQRGRSFGGRDSGGGRSFDRPREMTKVICSNCGKETEVPFKPTGDRPVYCRDCYAKMGGGERRSFGGDRRDDRGSRPFRKFDGDRPQGPSSNAQLSEINAKLDRLIELLSPKEKITKTEKPAIEAPVIEKPKKEKKVAKKKALKIVPELPEES